MNKNLFVGSLPYSTTEQSLEEAFSQAGPVVSVKIVTDRATGRSKGFGFVEMETDEGAQKAIAMWHEKEFGGRTIVVNEARPPRQDFQSGGGR
jgi:RNA recognition motif-containing protein